MAIDALNCKKNLSDDIVPRMCRNFRKACRDVTVTCVSLPFPHTNAQWKKKEEELP